MDTIEKRQFVIKLILKEIKKTIEKINKDTNEISLLKYGQPTKRVIVKYHNGYYPEAQQQGDVISVWRISIDKIENIDDLNCKPKYEPKSGWYYNEGIFNFSISSDFTSVLLDFVIGPRYISGMIYKIIFYDNGVSIDKKNTGYPWRLI